MGLREFVEARLSEGDRAWPSDAELLELGDFLGRWSADHSATVTESEIKSMRFAGREVLRALALRWADHPDYRSTA